MIKVDEPSARNRSSHLNLPFLYVPNQPSALGTLTSFAHASPSTGKRYALSFPSMTRRGDKNEAVLCLLGGIAFVGEGEIQEEHLSLKGKA